MKIREKEFYDRKEKMKPSVSRTIEKPDSPFMYKIKKQYEYVIPTNSNSPNRTIGMASENR
jgi:hypothetical protein